MKQKKNGRPDTVWRPVTPGLDRHIRRRVRVFAGCLAVLCFGGLTARLFWLQLLDPDNYAARAADQQLRDTVVPAARGEIYSADGTLLAASETCWTIRAAPRELADELVEPAAKALSEILDIDEAETLEKFRQRSSNDCLLRRRVDRETADAVRRWCEENGAEGIQIRQDTRRVYPQGDFMGCLLGFTDVDNAGLWGLELEYDEALTGENGRVLTAKNAWGYDMPEEYSTLIQAVPGDSLTLTIDANIQHMLEGALSAAVAEHHVAARGVGIVMDVQTGAILAMTTKPDYDPNDPRTIVDEETRNAVNALSGEERSQALQTAQQAQWRNKAISDLYEPGSVFKLITCAAALDTGAVTPSSQFVCAGKIKVSGTTFRCANGHIHGLETLAQGLAASCNPCFIQVGARLGKEAFCDYFAAFGLREATGIDLPGEIKRSEYYTADRMGPVLNFGPYPFCRIRADKQKDHLPRRGVTDGLVCYKGGGGLFRYGQSGRGNLPGLGRLRPAGFDQLVQQKDNQLFPQQNHPPGAFQKQQHLTQIRNREYIHAQNILPGGLVKIQVGGVLWMGAVDGLPQFLVPLGVGKAVGLDDLLAQPVRLEGDDLFWLQVQRGIRRHLPHQHQGHGRHVGGHAVGQHGV